MLKGAKVRLKGNPNGKIVTGIIETIVNRGTWSGKPPEYYIKYDQPDLIPPADWHTMDQLELLENPLNNVEVVYNRCCCGAKHTSFPEQHMVFCPLFRGK